MSTALLAAAVVTTPAHAATTVTDLGGLPSAAQHVATSVNDAGVAVGGAHSNGLPSRGVRYDGNGVATELVGPADASTTVEAVNSSGSAVGTATGKSGSRALRFNPDGTHVVLSVPSGFTGAIGQAISDSGTVYGVATDVTRRQIPVSWSPAGVITTLALPAGATWANLTNASANGYVAGYVTGPTIATTAVRWNPDGSATVLSGLAVDATTLATAVNQFGEVVGSAVAGDFQSWGVRWNADGSLNKYEQGFGPRSINDHGTVVGSSVVGGNQVPVLWERDGGRLELGFPAGVTTAGALDINNNGVVVGTAGSRAVKWVVG
ncbi:hypothetical protein UK23_21370 [Lentzea aerocolonigenes]|uniref:Uncharacterized protein n=1 Tax=Lentzea aerocolonigenes TaxID=68170 RepID=A0A0F0GV16_LENAE|nr:hypothetical protein [Lentzea aerocolonigenes]KJK47135.1 hypothetical protein UK23_21370 [Lentzea aerocolonigenes]